MGTYAANIKSFPLLTWGRCRCRCHNRMQVECFHLSVVRNAVAQILHQNIAHSQKTAMQTTSKYLPEDIHRMSCRQIHCKSRRSTVPGMTVFTESGAWKHILAGLNCSVVLSESAAPFFATNILMSPRIQKSFAVEHSDFNIA